MVQGNGQPQRADDELPAERRASFEQTMVMFETTIAERDRAIKELAALKQAHADEITALKLEHSSELARLGRELSEQDVRVESLQRLVDTLENRCKTHQDERDRAVDRRAQLQALFTTVDATLRAFEIESAPLVREAPR